MMADITSHSRACVIEHDGVEELIRKHDDPNSKFLFKM